MGSLPRLKEKDRLRYRKGSTNESENCQYCVNFVDFKEYREEVASLYGRCKLMGIKESVRYRARKDYTCDLQALDEAKCWWLKNNRIPEVISDDAKESVSMGNPGAPAL